MNIDVLVGTCGGFEGEFAGDSLHADEVNGVLFLAFRNAGYDRDLSDTVGRDLDEVLKTDE